MLLQRLRPKQRTKPNPVFYAERLRRLLAHDPERARRVFEDPPGVDLLTWNLFESLDTDDDREYVASLLEPLGGSDLAAPLRLATWTGRHREPQLRPSPAYERHLRERVGDDIGEDDLDDFLAPVEVPVRIEAANTLVLVETVLDAVPRGAGGRDRLVELVEVGVDQARNVGKPLTIAVVYRSGDATAGAVSARVNALRDPAALAAALPWRHQLPPVRFREWSWQHLLATWEHERDSLRLFGEPVHEFLEVCARLRLRAA